MNLSPMRFKNFIWPHNPQVYTITMERAMAAHKIPFGRHYLQSLGQNRRVFRGEGEFVGEGAYDTFKQLSTVFYEETPGLLIHPLWMTATAWFVGLKLEQQPRSDYVRYSFEFWEVISSVKAELKPRTEQGGHAQQGAPEDGGEQSWYTVVQGDSLWAIANRFDTTVERLLELNPGIRNPNLILVGQEVRVA